MRLAVFLAAIVLAVASAPLVNTSSAVLLVYEGFEYAPGALAGQNGGLGFSEAWGAGTVQEGSLAYTDGNSNVLPTAGNHALISGATGSLSAYRSLSRQIGTDAVYGPGTYWMSFLGQRLAPHATDDENRARSFSIQLHHGDGDERLGAGRVTTNPPVATDAWGIFSDGSPSFYDETTASMFDPSFVLLRIDIADSTDGNNSDSAAVWVNPNLDEALGAPEAELTPGAANNHDYIFDTLRLWAGNSASGNPYAEWIVDEIRIGTTIDDAVGNALLVPGDTDGDSVVEPEDLDPIRANYLTQVNLRSEGDLTGDLFVDFADFRQWKNAILNPGSGVGSLAGIDLSFLNAAVPEPASLVLLGSALAGLALTGRRLRRY